MVVMSSSFFRFGLRHRDLDGGPRTGDDRPASLGTAAPRRTAGDSFFVSRCKARRAAGKSRRWLLRESYEHKIMLDPKAAPARIG
jgi:hypothetical protein